MKDPYSTLGVSRDATDDEIKKAYRALARKYHPDNYAGSTLADVAEEKMKEVNEAYDAIQKARAAGTTFADPTDFFRQDGTQYTSTDFAGVRIRIRDGQYSEAELILDAMPQEQRGAEWNFLKGCVLWQRGFYFDAQKYIETACYLDPTNSEYQSARQQMRAGASQYENENPYRTSSCASGCSVCDLCSGLLCADCLCECCGGDLIRCC